jgi:hypothetical protein
MVYQGKLVDSSGNPIDQQTVSVTFRIYDSLSKPIEQALWSEVRSVTPKKGAFTIVLGENTPINLAFDVQYYLGLQVGTDSEMTPRLKLASAAYAFRAEKADNVTGVVPIANGGTGQASANAALNTLLPTQSGNANKFLQTDGTNATWASSSDTGKKLGSYGNSPNYNWSYANYLYATKYRCVKSCTISALALTGGLNDDGGKKIYLGIYSDNNGTPNTLLASTSEITITTNEWGGTIYGTISPITLTAGNYYWIAHINDTNCGFGTDGSVQDSHLAVSKSQSYGPLPSSFGTPSSAAYNFAKQAY